MPYLMLFGGLGLFLLGMERMSNSVRNWAGHRIRIWLQRMTRKKGVAVIMGIIFTILFQSSSAASVVLVGFIDAGLLTIKQTVPILLGTGVGTTITAQLISFNIGKFALLGVGLGFFAGSFGKGWVKSAGNTLLGLGLIFYGMQIMTTAMAPLKDNPRVADLITQLENPLLGVLAGMLITAMIQSSAAFIGILITLGQAGILSFESSLPLIIGTNIGTTVTALIASINASGKARQVAFVNSFFRIIAAVVFVFLLGPWEQLTGTLSGSDPARLMANAHTIFNIGMLVILFPFTGMVARWVSVMVARKREYQPRHLQYLNVEAIALGDMLMPILKKEVLAMGRMVYNMVDLCLIPFLSKDERAIVKIHKEEAKVDKYREEINRFLVKSHENIQIDSWSDESFRLLHVMNELEQIADIVSVNIMHQAEEWLKGDMHFSEQGENELKEYHMRTLKQLNRAFHLIESWDPGKAMRLKKKYRKYAYMAFDLEVQHYKRLFSGAEATVGSSKAHMELINLLRVVNSRATNFGRIVLLEEEDTLQQGE
ncbi:Na/Pi cotransporter family protein [Marinilabiliaceae bacterium JC017]|nr:Na/Pi cotransporter family protein [Marinilabiliaceae bacterium JC017]